MSDFFTTRLQSFRDHTAMWGCNEAVEAQALLLIELELREKDREKFESNARLVMDTYCDCLREGFPGRGGNKPVFTFVEDQTFGSELYRICQLTRKALGLTP